MDKQTFLWILESALLNFDGLSEEKLVGECEIDRKLARAGIEICQYLKSIEMKGGNEL